MKMTLTKATTSALMFTLLSACGGGSSDDDFPNDRSQNVSELFQSMQTWSEFAPKLEPEENEGVERVDESRAPFVEDIVDSNNNVKVCTTETVDFFETPEEYVMFSPPTNVLYPGALVIGKSIRDGANAGEILPLNIAQRAEVDVTISACNFAGNTRRVTPTLAEVNSAVGDIINQARLEGVDCINPVGNLTVETYRNEEQRALSAKMSGRYFGFSASASGSYSKGTVENSVAAVFRESLYTVDISAPQSPAGWFTNEFTSERLDEQQRLGTMGEDNIPVYVARVTYGRIMTSTFTSNESETDLRAAIEFKYQNPAIGVQGEAAAESQRIRQNARITQSYLGGSAQATGAMLQSNDWTQYFSVPVTAEDAVPISFELRSTKDNVPAVVQEFTSYERTTCVDKLGDDGTFDFLTELEFTPNFSTPAQTLAMGDVDGVNGDDIVWAATSLSARGEYAIALSNGDGTFQPVIKGEHTLANNVAGRFTLLLADIDNDGAEDVVMNILPSEGSNNTYLTFMKSGSLINSAPQTLFETRGWDTYFAYSGQMDKAHGTDLVFNNTPNSNNLNRTYIATAVDTTAPGFDLSTGVLLEMQPAWDHPSRNFSGYQYTYVEDFNNDGYGDIVWQRIGEAGNFKHGAFGSPTTLVARDLQSAGSRWQAYTSMAGDVTGDGNVDIVEPRTKTTFQIFGIYIAEGSGVGATRNGAMFDPHSFKIRNRAMEEASIQGFFGQPVSDDSIFAQSPPPDIFLADVNGDGAKDMIINDKGYRNSVTNAVGVGLAIVGGSEFTFTRVSQSLAPAVDWSQYKAHVADINDDGKEDIVWIASAVTNSVFVGISR